MARLFWQHYFISYITEHSEWPLFSDAGASEPIDTSQFIPYLHPSYQSSPKYLLPKLVSNIHELFTYEQSDTCIDTLLRCLTLSRFICESDSLQVAAFHLNLATAYLELKLNPIQTNKHVNNAIKIIDLHRLTAETNTNFSAVLLNIKASLVSSKSQLLQHKSYESLNLLRDASSDAKLLQTLNPNFRDSNHLVFILYQRGHVHKYMFKYKLALRDFREALDLVSNIFGGKSEHVVLLLIEIVEVLTEMSLFDKAMRYAERCYELSHSFEVLQPDAALVLAKLHFSSNTKQSYIESSKYFDEWSTSVSIDCVGGCVASFRAVVANLEQYILVLSKTGNQQRTYAILNQLIRIYTDKYGEMCVEVANLCRQLGLCFLSEGNIKSGVEQLEVARDAFDFSSGKHNKESKNIELILCRVDPTHKYQSPGAAVQQEKIRFKTIV